MNWLVFSILSAGFAALVAIFAKLGLKSVDSNLVAIVRAVVMALFLLGFGFLSGKLNNFSFGMLAGKDGVLILLSGLAGAISWLFYFLALKTGLASKVSAVDRLSLVFVIVLSVLFLGEKLTLKTALGAALMVLGAILVALK
ncbi:TPA: EamA family transporter [Patescibacteria group bacterium]|nr:EamA family transporter [Patescibacteria group bacterium]